MQEKPSLCSGVLKQTLDLLHCLLGTTDRPPDTTTEFQEIVDRVSFWVWFELGFLKMPEHLDATAGYRFLCNLTD